MIVLMAPNHPLDLSRCRAGTEPALPWTSFATRSPSPYGARLWETVRQGAEESVGTDPLLPGTALPRPARRADPARQRGQTRSARRWCGGCCATPWCTWSRARSATGKDALTQIEALFDPKRWPQWLDFAHEMFQADLRTGQLGAAVALTYDWLYEHLSARRAGR